MTEKRDWSWMKDHMPQVVARLRIEREQGRGELINECWRRGVLGQEPGYFYAWQNGISIGVPSVEFLRDPNQAALAQMFPNRMVLMLNGEMHRPESVTQPVVADKSGGFEAKRQHVAELLHGTD